MAITMMFIIVTSTDVDEAIELFKEKKADSVISVCEFNHPIQWAKNIDSTGRLINFFDEDFMRNFNRQELSTTYVPNGAIFVFKYELLKNKMGRRFDPWRSFHLNLNMKE